jgi:hypothetical protein
MPLPNLLIPNNLLNFLDILRTSMVKYALENGDDLSVEHDSAARHEPGSCHILSVTSH